VTWNGLCGCATLDDTAVLTGGWRVVCRPGRNTEVVDVGSVGRRDGGYGREAVLLRLRAVLRVGTRLAGWRRVWWDWLVVLSC
jgi:hypothetical protein